MKEFERNNLNFSEETNNLISLKTLYITTGEGEF